MAQIAFPSDSTVWNVYSQNANDRDTAEYFLEGDTLLYSENWTKLYCRKPQGPLLYCGALKTTGDVVEIKLPDQDRQLLYDFGLSVGDTFPIPPVSDHYGFGFDSILVVERIDTIQLINGELRKVISSNTLENCIFEEVKEEWIEGIGSTHGPLFPLSCRRLTVEMNEEVTLACYSEMGNLLYQDPRFGNCLSAGIDDLTGNDFFTVYPNPTSGCFRIENSYPEDIEKFELFDMAGKCVFRTTSIETIDMARFNNGIYIGNITYKDMKRFSFKIIKN